MNKETDFSEWYNEITEKAMLTDKRYQVKGTNVWLPYGWKISLNIDRIIRDEMGNNNHDEVCFPTLIPETDFNKERDHIKGFTEEVYWVTKAGGNDLDVNLLLRPTSETAMYPMFSLWIRSHADLPLRIFQIVNTFRYETKQTRAFIRVREMHFFEAHTCHATYEEAEEQIKTDLDIMNKIARKLCIPYIVCIRPDWDKFPGAKYTLGIDTFMGGKTLQIASIHQYGDNFSKPYNIMFEDLDGKQKHVSQTTYGMSERLVGAIVGIHGDAKGLVLPPSIAPIQVIIVPIYTKENRIRVETECNELLAIIKNDGIRADIDKRDIRPGNKFYYWEEKGVPIRIEVGEREVSSHAYIIKKRTGGSADVGMKTASSIIKKVLDDISDTLFENAKKTMDNIIIEIDKRDAIKDTEGIVKVPWCGSESCAHELENIPAFKIHGIPYVEETIDSKYRKCVVCNKQFKNHLVMARTF